MNGRCYSPTALLHLSSATFGLRPLSRWRTASDPFREFLGSRFTVPLLESLV